MAKELSIKLNKLPEDTKIIFSDGNASNEIGLHNYMMTSEDGYRYIDTAWSPIREDFGITTWNTPYTVNPDGSGVTPTGLQNVSQINGKGLFLYGITNYNGNNTLPVSWFEAKNDKHRFIIQDPYGDVPIFDVDVKSIRINNVDVTNIESRVSALEKKVGI